MNMDKEEIIWAQAYNQGFRHGKQSRAKPLKWRTGPSDNHPPNTIILAELPDTEGLKHDVRPLNWCYGKFFRYIPLSEILDLIGGE